MFLLKGGEKLQFFLEVGQEPLPGFDRIVGRGKQLVEELVRLVRRGLAESSGRCHCSSPAVEKRVHAST
jgi:hypothetical protein